jgi:hypothetical protein
MTRRGYQRYEVLSQERIRASYHPSDSGSPKSHPLLRWPMVRMRHRADNVLKHQGDCERLSVRQLNQVEYENRGCADCATPIFRAGPTRLELATSGVTGRRSNQLNYDPRTTRWAEQGLNL